MIPRSLRGRVAFAAAAATAVVILLGGALVTVLVSRAEHEALDRSLREQAQAVELPVINALTNGSLVDAPDFYLQRPDIGTIVRVYRNGTLVMTAGSPSINFPQPADSGFDDVVADGRPWRMLTTSANESGTSVVMQVAVPSRGTQQVVADLRRQVLFVAGLSAGLAAVAGWILGEVALRPLSRLRFAAERISSSRDLGMRVPAADGPQEVDDLASSFNVMLERLQDASGSTEAALASSRAFAGNAAHEMRTPLTSMQANLEVLTKNPDLPPEQTAEIVAALTAQQRRLVRLIDALQSLARGDVVGDEQKEMLDLADITGVAIETIRRAAPNVNIEYEIPVDESEIFGWSDGLRLMVDNLLTNAVRHAGDFVKVTVDRSSETEDPAMVLIIDDNGPGVPEEDRTRIFERFARGREVRTPGSGLGLALVAQQAKLHHGSVVVTESPLGGARFVVTLPITPPPATNEQAPSDPSN